MKMTELEQLKARVAELEGIVDAQASRFYKLKAKHAELHNYIHDWAIPNMRLAHNALYREAPKVTVAIEKIEIALEYSSGFNKYE